MPRKTPSGSGLPACWNEEMDRFICRCDALGDLEMSLIILGLKRNFPQLTQVRSFSIPIMTGKGR